MAIFSAQDSNSMGATTGKQYWAKSSSLQGSRVHTGNISSEMSKVPCGVEENPNKLAIIMVRRKGI